MREVDIDLGYDPREWQAEVHLALQRFNVLALHRRAGKTVLSVAELVDKAISHTRKVPEGRFGYIAPYLKQAKNIAWAKLKQRVAPLIKENLVTINESDLSVTFVHNGARIMLFGADNADAIRGDYFDGVVMDEVAQMDPDVWNEVVRPMLADYRGWALFIGTPNGVNLFSELYYAAHSKPDWFAATYTVYETNALHPDEVEEMRRDMSEKSFERELLCSFEVAGDNQLISLGDLIEASRRQLKPEDYRYAPKIIGVDPARFGNDRSVICMRQGLKVEPPIVIPGIDNAALVDRIIELKYKWEADAIMCDAGQGAGVIDFLRRLGHQCTEVWFNGKPSKPQYHDKRSEMWCEMADMVPMLSMPPGKSGEAMRKDLAAPTYEFMTGTGKKRLESKDDIKERLLMSPDIGDALALTFAFPVEKKTPAQDFMATLEKLGQKAEAEYDPYTRQQEYDPYA